MKIKIYRPNQVGGCITEISNDTTKIIFDFGEELEKSINPIDEYKLLKNCDAIFFSHYHGDHIGLIDKVPNEVPMYLGATAKEIFCTYVKRTSPSKLGQSNKLKTYTHLQNIKIGNITVTPILTNHSAFDSYMFLINDDDKRILYTGDFRTHGIQGDEIFETLEKYAQNIDVMICEGTILDRSKEKIMTEIDLQEKATDIMSKYKYVFVLCSSTNIDRIAAFYHARKRKYFICDEFQKEILIIAKDSQSPNDKKYDFKYAYKYGKNLDEEMNKRGFCMLIRQGKFFQGFLDKYKEDSIVIYSMWTGYLDDRCKKDDLVDFLSPYKYRVLHTSGHATVEAIEKVCNSVKPKTLIPIHTSDVSKIYDLNIDKSIDIKILFDNEIYGI